MVVPMEVRLATYSGPMDLLLELIHKNKINIYDIPIHFITQAYLDALTSIPAENIEYRVEFFYLAAALLQIKSKMLLPQTDLDDEDPRLNLVEHLIAYSQCKMACEALMPKYETWMRRYERAKSPIFFRIKWIEPEYSLDALSKTYENLMDRLRKGPDSEALARSSMARDAYSTDELAEILWKRLKGTGTLHFQGFIHNHSDRMYIITAFLALLDLMHRGYIVVRQEGLFEDIYLEMIS